MKTLYPTKHIAFGSITAILLTVCMFLNGSLMAQDDAKKSKIRVTLNYTITNNAERQVTATVKTKIGRSYKGVADLDVYFYNEDQSEANQLGVQKTDGSGNAQLNLSQANLSTTKQLTLIAVAKETEKYLTKSRSIEISPSKLTMDLKIQDSVKTINLSFSALDTLGQAIPKEDVTVKLFVKRMFGNLPLSEDFIATDENGEISAAFPETIKGDTEGTIEIIALIDDESDYGTVLKTEQINWGAVLVVDEQLNNRELWAARANTPIYLLVIVNGMILGIWGTIMYLVFQIFKIRKLGKPAV
jgi:hypothetical protein